MSQIAEVLLVLTTVGSRDAADTLAAAMVEQRLAACVHIQAIDSVYRWKGQVQNDPEWRLLFKTTAARYATVEAALRAAHPYELPAILAWPCSHGLQAFADWVDAETRPVPDA